MKIKRKSNKNAELYMTTKESLGNEEKDRLDFRKFAYVITTETLYANDEQHETLWKITGHIEKEVEDGKKPDMKRSGKLKISDLSEIVDQVPNNLQIRIQYSTGKTVKIDDVRFLDYGHIFEKDYIKTEYIDFIGYMDSKNRYA